MIFWRLLKDIQIITPKKHPKFQEFYRSHFEDNKMILTDTKRNNFVQFQLNYDKMDKIKKNIADNVEIDLLNFSK